MNDGVIKVLTLGHPFMIMGNFFGAIEDQYDKLFFWNETIS
jgi:hypothetical protein